VLVTHDRYMLDRVSTVVLGLDGLGHAERFADCAQWEEWQEAQMNAAKSKPSAGVEVSPQVATAPAVGKKKLSFKETRELETIEQRIADAEKELQTRHESLLDPAVMSDGPKLREVSLEMEAAQKSIEELYARWAELDEKKNVPT
jgi:ATP-binding cassette subfamily F protein uup